MEHWTINVNRDEKSKSIWEQIDDIKIAPKLDIFISMRNINALNVNGNGKLVTENSISSKDLTLTNSGIRNIGGRPSKERF